MKNDLKQNVKNTIGNAAKAVGDLAGSIDMEKAKETLGDAVKAAGDRIGSFDVEKAKESVGDAAKTAGAQAMVAADKAKLVAVKAKDAVVEVVDANGNGEIDVEDFIIWGLRTPGIWVERDDFLRKEFLKRYPSSVIEDAVAHTPAHAGITPEEIDGIADSVIQYERNCVAGISTALGMPGGAAMVATIPADLIQYYGYMLRAAQKLMYLYGFPAINTTENGSQFDSETMNLLTLCLGVMYGVAGTSNALKAMARALGAGVEKKLLRAALTKGTFYPLVKSAAKWFNVRMTKTVFAGFFKKAIPVVGGALGGGITYLSFKPCCDKLKASLRDTVLSNPEHQANEEELQISNAIILDVEAHEAPPQTESECPEG